MLSISMVSRSNRVHVSGLPRNILIRLMPVIAGRARHRARARRATDASLRGIPAKACHGVPDPCCALLVRLYSAKNLPTPRCSLARSLARPRLHSTPVMRPHTRWVTKNPSVTITPQKMPTPSSNSTSHWLTVLAASTRGARLRRGCMMAHLSLTMGCSMAKCLARTSASQRLSEIVACVAPSRLRVNSNRGVKNHTSFWVDAAIRFRAPVLLPASAFTATQTPQLTQADGRPVTYCREDWLRMIRWPARRAGGKSAFDWDGDGVADLIIAKCCELKDTTLIRQLVAPEDPREYTRWSLRNYRRAPR